MHNLTIEEFKEEVREIQDKFHVYIDQCMQKVEENHVTPEEMLKALEENFKFLVGISLTK